MKSDDFQRFFEKNKLQKKMLNRRFESLKNETYLGLCRWADINLGVAGKCITLILTGYFHPQT
jgi:hypothetical protein